MNTLSEKDGQNLYARCDLWIEIPFEGSIKKIALVSFILYKVEQDYHMKLNVTDYSYAEREVTRVDVKFSDEINVDICSSLTGDWTLIFKVDFNGLLMRIESPSYGVNQSFKIHDHIKKEYSEYTCVLDPHTGLFNGPAEKNLDYVR